MAKRRLSPLLGGVLLLAILSEARAADDFIELVVPLENGRHYSLRQVQRLFNEKLGTSYSLGDDQRLELSSTERGALLLAQEAGLLQVRIEADRLVLLLPDSEVESVRRANRGRLESLLGIELSEWPAGKGLSLPKALDSSAPAVLLIHGLESSPGAMDGFAVACRNRGVQTITFDYPNDGPLAWSGDHLSAELNGLSKRHPRLRLVVIAHSMGGLVARYVVETPGKNPGNITDLFLLGCPNQGSSLAAEQPLLELFCDALGAGKSFADMFRDGLGEAADDLQPGSRFLRTLNAQGRADGVRYHVAIGRKSLLQENEQLAVERSLAQLLRRRQTSESARSTILKFLGRDEFRAGKGDGAVSVQSARLEGAHTKRLFDLNHLELLALSADRPEDTEVFRWILQTLQWDRKAAARR